MADTKISALPASTTPLAGTEVLPIVQSSTTKQVSVANLTAGRDVSAKTETLKPRNGVKPTNNSVVTGLTIFNDQDNVTGDGVSLFFDHSFGTPGLQTRGVKFRSYGETTYSGYVGAKFQVTNNGSFIESLYLKGSGDVQVTSGNLVIGTAGNGFNFTANSTAPAGTMTSQLLNWYEEGTWTPSDQSGAGLTFTSSSGKYTRIGNTVYATGFVQYPATANASQAIIGGLPWNSANSTSSGNVAIGYKSASTLDSMQVVQSNNTIKLWTSTGTATTNAGVASTQIYFTAIYPVS